MSVLFKHENGAYYASIPTLPIVSKSLVLCVFKSVGFINTSAPYLKKIGKVLRVIYPNDPEHKWWEIAHAKDYVTPNENDVLVVASFGRMGEEMFLPKDMVQIVPICLN